MSAKGNSRKRSYRPRFTPKLSERYCIMHLNSWPFSFTQYDAEHISSLSRKLAYQHVLTLLSEGTFGHGIGFFFFTLVWQSVSPRLCYNRCMTTDSYSLRFLLSIRVTPRRNTQTQQHAARVRSHIRASAMLCRVYALSV